MTGMAPVDADLLGRLSRLHVRARQLASGGRVGLHRARRQGVGAELEDWQPYRAGMDLRRIDWRAWARTDRLLVRRHRVETDLPVVVVLDASADLASGAESAHGRRPDLTHGKAGNAIVLAATLAMACWNGGEPVGLHVLAGSVASQLPPCRARSHLAELFRILAALEPQGRAHLAEQLGMVAARVPRHAVVFLVTDAMEPLDGWAPSLRAFAERRVDLRVLHVRDEAELRLAGLDVAWLRSPETGEERLIDAAVARPALQAAAAAHDLAVRHAVHAAGGAWWPVDTGGELSRGVLGALQGREYPS